VAQDRNQWKALVNMINDIQIPNNAENFVVNWSITGFSQRPLLHLHSLLIRQNEMHLINSAMREYSCSYCSLFLWWWIAGREESIRPNFEWLIFI
jgi:hypothetical protein